MQQLLRAAQPAAEQKAPEDHRHGYVEHQARRRALTESVRCLGHHEGVLSHVVPPKRSICS